MIKNLLRAFIFSGLLLFCITKTQAQIDYKVCVANLVNQVIGESNTPKPGFILAPNGKNYGIQYPDTPYMGRMDQMRYWMKQDISMNTLFVYLTTKTEDEINVWFNNMSITYKFMVFCQYMVAHDHGNFTPNRQFNLLTINNKWNLRFDNGGMNPQNPPPPRMECQ